MLLSLILVFFNFGFRMTFFGITVFISTFFGSDLVYRQKILKMG